MTRKVALDLSLKFLKLPQIKIKVRILLEQQFYIYVYRLELRVFVQRNIEIYNEMNLVMIRVVIENASEELYSNFSIDLVNS